MADMMQQPQYQQAMQSMLQNPQLMDYLISSHPSLRNMGPQVRQMMQSEEFRRAMTDPNMIMQMAQMQRMFGGNQSMFGMDGTGNQAQGFPAPGITNTTPAPRQVNSNTPSTQISQDTNAENNQEASTQSQAQQANPFASLLGGGGNDAQGTNPFGFMLGMGQQNTPQQQAPDMSGFWNTLLGANTGSGIVGESVPQDSRPPEERYEQQLRQLNDMGFTDFDKNVQALRRSGGSVQGAIDALLSGI